MKTWLPATILAVVLAGGCAPSVSVLPERSDREKQISDLESAVTEMKSQRSKPVQAPGTEPPKPVDPARDAMEHATYNPDPSVVGGVVATVNGEIITREEVLRDAKPQFDAIGRDETLTDMGREEKRRAVIGAFILLKVERLLALQEARRVIRADESEQIQQEVDTSMSDVIRALGNMARAEVMLRQEGKTIKTQKQVEMDNRRIRKLIDREVNSHVDVTPAEVQKYYAEHPDEFVRKAEVQVREIFASAEKRGSIEAATERAKALRGRVKAGEDFAKVAKEASDGPNAAEGGLWERATAGAGTFRPEVEQAAFALSKGELSEVVVSEIGAHVLKAEDVKRARTLSFAEAQDEIAKKITNRKRDEVYGKFIRRLWDKSAVEICWK